MRPENIPKTANITPFGLLEFTRLTFGLKNAGQTFQRLMDRVGADMLFVFIYLDNILVDSPDAEVHLLHLRSVLQRLLVLSHYISAGGVEPLLKLWRPSRITRS
jgi:hypothetical protein